MASPIQVGFHDQRSCSRILKPPGGGTSDIFGTERIFKEIKVSQQLPDDKKPEPEAPKVEPEPAQEQKEAATNGGPPEVVQRNGEAKENGAVEESKVEDVKIEQLKLEENSKEDVGGHNTPTKAEYKTSSISNILRQDGAVIDATTPGKKITPNKNRVPPGGYSSGLW